MIAHTVLLDTNALLRLATDDHLLGVTARSTLSAADIDLVVSAASAWEIAIKTGRGKLPGGDEMIALWDEILSDLRATEIAVDRHDAIYAGTLAWSHRDPFDRMLVAQAIRRGMVIATSDETMLAAPTIDTLDTRR